MSLPVWQINQWQSQEWRQNSHVRPESYTQCCVYLGIIRTRSTLHWIHVNEYLRSFRFSNQPIINDHSAQPLQTSPGSVDLPLETPDPQCVSADFLLVYQVIVCLLSLYVFVMTYRPGPDWCCSVWMCVRCCDVDQCVNIKPWLPAVASIMAARETQSAGALKLPTGPAHLCLLLLPTSPSSFSLSLFLYSPISPSCH